ncbi:MAG: MFS transporter [Jatrophihabitantaceae bacterium]
MARKRDDRPHRRFSKSGHTRHDPGPPGIPPYVPPPYAPKEYAGAERQPMPAPEPAQQFEPARVRPSHGASSASPDGFGAPSYHHVASGAPDAGQKRGPASPAVAITRATVTHTHRAARAVTRKIISASRADGANESGLTALIWNQVLSYGTDAMITVALAGTVFFGASTTAQRGNVLLYLLITMAPFAVVAPVIGPVLDRLQHGRRWTMAGTAIGRAVLALVMAAHPTELLVLYPCALGSLVLSKAYGVIRAAAAPRLVPPGMTLTEANARLSIFGLGSTLISGGLVGVLIKTTGSYSLGLVVTAIAFGACGFSAVRLPPQVDSAARAARHPEEPPRPLTQERVAPVARIRSWARRGFDEHLVLALQGESVLRLLSGLLTIYLAFYVESTAHGLPAALQLGAVIGAAGAGNFAGTAIGTKLRLQRPEMIIVVSVVAATATCALVALLFSIAVAVVGMFVSAATNSLSKIALDALVQRDVVETLRSSAFARSETFLQLAWVVGAAIGVVLPSGRGTGGALGFWVAALVVGAVAAVVLLRRRVLERAAGPRTAAVPR